MVSLRLPRSRAADTSPPVSDAGLAAAQGSPAASPASADVWPAEWLRGALEVCVIGVLDRGPTYGYAIAAALEDAGLGVVKGGTLYPLLGRLEAAGLVDVEWRAGESGPGRKYYALNDDGRAILARRAAQWGAFTAVTHRLVVGDGGRATDPTRRLRKEAP